MNTSKQRRTKKLRRGAKAATKFGRHAKTTHKLKAGRTGGLMAHALKNHTRGKALKAIIRGRSDGETTHKSTTTPNLAPPAILSLLAVRA